MISDIKGLDSLGGTATLAVPHKCILTAVNVINTTGAALHVQLFDKATAAEVTVGTTVPTWVTSCAASVSAADPGLPEGGLLFENGIVAASTTTTTGATGATSHARLGIQ